jgi:long-chain fatty acid transport protein
MSASRNAEKADGLGPKAERRPRGARAAWVALAVVTCGAWLGQILGAGRAEATFLDGLGAGARPMAMGSAYTAVADDLFAVYYNPAGLTQLDKHEVVAGYLWSGPSLEVRSPNEPSFAEATPAPGDLRTPVIAVGFNLDQVFRDVPPVHLRAGLLNYIPDNFKSAIRIQDPDPASPRWVRAGDYWDRVHLLFAVSLQPEGVRWISLGAGFRLLVSGRGLMVPHGETGGAVLVLRGFSGEVVSAEANLDIEVHNEAAPTAGILLSPRPNLRVAYSFRGSCSVVAGPSEADAEARILLGHKEIVLPLVLEATFEAFYLPEQHNFGVSWLYHEKLLVCLDLSWFRWSRYTSESRGAPDPRWRDSVIPRVGLEYRPIQGWAVRLGYFFEPSPVPEQKRASNLLDNDRHVFSAGAGYTFQDPLGIVREPLTLDVALQYIHMPSRRTEKDPGYSPGFETEGHIVSATGNLTVRF